MSWNHGYALDEYQTRKNGGDHGITWRDIFKCQSFTEMLFGVPWSQRFFLIFHRMGELRESREAANTIREAARDYGKEIISLRAGSLVWVRDKEPRTGEKNEARKSVAKHRSNR